jgi:hypothetical protein
VARTVLGKGLAPLMAGNKPPETGAEAVPPAKPGVVTLILGKQDASALVDPPAVQVPAAIPAVQPSAPPVFQPPVVLPLPVWPFVLADVLLVGAALLLLVFAAKPLSMVACVVAGLLVLAGGALTLLPFWLNAQSGAQPKTPQSSPFRDHLPVERA